LTVSLTVLASLTRSISIIKAQVQNLTSDLLKRMGVVRGLSQSSSSTNSLQVGTQLTASQPSSSVRNSTIRITKSALQAATASITNGVLWVRTTTQAASTTLIRALSLTEAVSQATIGTVSKGVALTRSVVQTVLGSLSELQGVHVFSQLLVATQSQVASYLRSLGIIKNVSQSETPSATKAIRVSHLVVQSSSAIVRSRIGKILGTIGHAALSVATSIIPGGPVSPSPSYRVSQSVVVDDVIDQEVVSF